MQNNFISKLSPTSKLVVLLLILIMIILAKSLYLMCFLTVLLLICIIISNNNVNEYLKSFSKIKYWLIFITLTYIIVFRNVASLLIIMYKLSLVVIYLKIFILNINFDQFNSAIYELLKPLRKKNIDIDNISMNITLYFYCLYTYLNLDDEFKKIQKYNEIEISKASSAKSVLNKIIISNDRMVSLKNDLIFKCYKIDDDALDFKSIFILLMFIILAIVCLFKEVIL